MVGDEIDPRDVPDDEISLLLRLQRTADIALVKDDLADILYVRHLSRQAITVARQNFWLATSTNLGGAAAGALGLLSPVAAGLIHIVHTLGVLANSSRLLVSSPPDENRNQPRS